MQYSGLDLASKKLEKRKKLAGTLLDSSVPVSLERNE